MINYGFLIWAIVAILVHEVGHYLVARKQNIYLGWGIIPFPHIKLQREFKSNINYLSGFFASLLTLPLWMFIVSYSLLWFFLFCFIIAAADFLVFFKFKRKEE